MSSEKTPDIYPGSEQHYYGMSAGYSPSDDEINLIEVWRILAGKKKIILISTLICLVVGALVSFLKPVTYKYVTALQIGSYSQDDKKVTIQDTKNAESKIKEVYISSVLNDYYRTDQKAVGGVKINVKVPKDSQIIIVETQSTEADAPVYIGLAEKIVDSVLKDDGNKIKEYKNALLAQIAQASARLDKIKQDEIALNKRTETFESSFNKNPADKDNTNFLIMTALTTQMQTLFSQRNAMELLISQKKTELGMIEETKQLYPFTRSIEPDSLSKPFTVLIALSIGLCVGIIVALILNIIRKQPLQSGGQN